MSFGLATRVPAPVCRVDPSQGAGNDALPAAIVSIRTAGEFFTGMRKWRHFSAIRGRRRVRFESSQCAMGEKLARPI